MRRFDTKTVLVTGGNSGIGLATARAFAAEGARLVITGRNINELQAARSQLGEGSLAIRNDAAVVSEAAALAKELTAHGVRLDAVFINAGITKFSAFEQTTEALWDATFNTNVKGAYFQLQALLPLLNPGGAIVLSGSINAHIGAAQSSVYAASKAALISLAKTLSGELLPRKIRVNVISPGPIQTPLYNKLVDDPGKVDGVVSQIRSLVPLGRFGTPEEVASTVLHLAASESAFIVGTEVVIDGGMSQL
jgi:NAD(P)-dependent dehydrogenase (short-subunit alcohol dehydrogenase family)